MEARSSGPLVCCSAPPNYEKKWKVTAIKNKTGECYRGSNYSGSQIPSNRKSQEALDIKLDTKNLIPANIRHKYGSTLVDQLISPEQVQNCLRHVEERRKNVSRAIVKSDTQKPWLMEEYPHRMYYELSHCLRSNLFPGMPINQHSLVHDSYTIEVNERGRLNKGNTQHWYGRKTDDLALWSQKLMERDAITKILESQQKPSRVFPLRIQLAVPKEDLSPPTPAAKKPKKQQQAKPKKPKAPTPPAIQPDPDDNFWDFYDRPIP
ncbi:ciliary microtubule inner protein 4 [Pyxicephalus adspersus]|uniref:ciliary microtubule inner protein 4 n=1 Tax=Pyxicephalus adspersus TaxID=30357 RepID=UPI003B59D696